MYNIVMYDQWHISILQGDSLKMVPNNRCSQFITLYHTQILNRENILKLLKLTIEVETKLIIFVKPNIFHLKIYVLVRF